jgi:hypothetical protein
MEGGVKVIGLLGWLVVRFVFWGWLCFWFFYGAMYR